MTITIQKFYGGYRKLEFLTTHKLGVLEKRFIRASSFDHDGELFLPPANALPLIPGGAVFTIWNVGYYNIRVKDADGNAVGCLQGTNREPSTMACRTNIHLITNATTAGEWRMDCAVCIDPPNTNSTDTAQTDDDGSNTTTTTTQTDDGGDGYHQNSV